MKCVINGLRYDADTSELLCGVLSECCLAPGLGNEYHQETHMYRTAKGAFFLAGKGGSESKWAKCIVGIRGATEQMVRMDGEGIEPIDDAKALHYLEEQDEHELIEKYFSDIVQDA